MGYTRAVLQGLTPYAIYLDRSVEQSNGDVIHYFKIGRYKGNPPVLIPITVSSGVMKRLEIPTPKTHPEIWAKGVDGYNKFADEKRLERAEILWAIVHQIDRDYWRFINKKANLN